MDIWEKASGLRRQGCAPSIADFEQLLVTAKLEKASVSAIAAKMSPDDMSVRCLRLLCRCEGACLGMLPENGYHPPHE